MTPRWPIHGEAARASLSSPAFAQNRLAPKSEARGYRDNSWNTRRLRTQAVEGY
jgi:hypothetical protein